ncbi:class I SAM-dependent methyltransferase [Paraglaciecola marina]|uniref:class I SAM-dependent methyltransferase n=1 Tax=Paraglaciecola marina TaxID=2500157 RepID=UPI00105BBB8D|nr:methyltransferase domain-containing protein [Paraglaciecola marina]
MSDYWSQYWKQGHLTSFGEEIKGNYQGLLADTWKAFFKNNDDTASILDIGTGNGALLALAREANKNTNLFGIDSATLSITQELAVDPQMKFFSNIQAESLPFNDAKFDVGVSQFGIEYSNLTLAIPELSRVLKSGAKFQFVLHDSQSSIVKPNNLILKAAHELNAQEGALTTMKRMIQQIGSHGDSSKGADVERVKLNQLIGELVAKNRQGIWGTNFPSFLKYVMSKNWGVEKRLEMLSLFKKELLGQVERLTDLIDASLNEKKYQLLTDLCADSSLEVSEFALLNEHGNIIARKVNGFKR